MKPRIQCVLTHWMSGFTASGRGPGAGGRLMDGGQHGRRTARTADSTEPGSPGLGRPGDPGSGAPCGYYPTAEAVPPPSWGPGLLVELPTVLPLLTTGSLASSGAGTSSTTSGLATPLKVNLPSPRCPRCP